MDDTYTHMMVKGCCPGTFKKTPTFCSCKIPIYLGICILSAML